MRRLTLLTFMHDTQRVNVDFVRSNKYYSANWLLID